MSKASKGEKINKAAVGIVHEELNEDNYENWKSCLKNYLVGHGLWGVVSGKDKQPSRDNKQEYEEWKKMNALALHAIQLSCGASTYSKFKEAHMSAAFAWKHFAEKIKRPSKLQQFDFDEDHNGRNEHLDYEPLYEAIEKGHLSIVKNVLDHDSNAVRARVSSHKETALHIAILFGHMRIAHELVSRMTPEDLELVNEYGATPLSLAAISGVTKLAKAMVEKNHELVSKYNDHDDGNLPVIVAAINGQKSMVRYLYGVTPKEDLHPERGENDIASLLLERYPKLGVTADYSGNYPLQMLAHKPSAFPSGTKLVFWKRWISSCVVVHSTWGSQQISDEEETMGNQSLSTTDDHIIDIHDSSDEEIPGKKHGGQLIAKNARGRLHVLGWRILRFFVPDVKHIHDRKLVNDETVKLLRCILKELRKLSQSQLQKMDIDKILYDAIKHGIIEFVEEILKYNPEFIWRKDKKGRTVFAQAILLRQEKIYSLIYKLGTQKSIIALRQDMFGNNFLHLAAKLPPPTQLERVSGAALQMQRELQWFKEVESIVPPKLKKGLNDNKKTPEMLFSDEHESLHKEGERWMKNAAKSSMIVGTFIASVMFATAFTVPRAYWMVSNAISMFASSTSLLMFFAILTAHYTEKDFLYSLPTKLIVGFACLLLSIVTMTVYFGTSVYLIQNKTIPWVSYPLIIFSTIPVALFTLVQFPLVIEMLFRTYGSGIFDKPKKKRFWWF